MNSGNTAPRADQQFESIAECRACFTDMGLPAADIEVMIDRAMKAGKVCSDGAGVDRTADLMVNNPTEFKRRLAVIAHEEFASRPALPVRNQTKIDAGWWISTVFVIGLFAGMVLLGLHMHEHLAQIADAMEQSRAASGEPRSYRVPAIMALVRYL